MKNIEMVLVLTIAFLWWAITTHVSILNIGDWQVARYQLSRLLSQTLSRPREEHLPVGNVSRIDLQRNARNPALDSRQILRADLIRASRSPLAMATIHP
jgi:hypothetical protein